MTNIQKHALLREANYYQINGLIAMLQADVKQQSIEQRRELTMEKEYKLCEFVPQHLLSETIKKVTTIEGYDFESWIEAIDNSGNKTNLSPTGQNSNSNTQSINRQNSQSISTSSNNKPIGTGPWLHILFSKKLSRGELMLLDRLQNHT